MHVRDPPPNGTMLWNDQLVLLCAPMLLAKGKPRAAVRRG